MTRADAEQVRCHFKGQDDDFIVIVESASAVKKWKGDKSVPLVDVVNSFDVFCTHKHGVQGQLERASKALLENEFGTARDEDVVKQILEKGTVQESKVPARDGDRNLANGPGASSHGAMHN